MVMMICFKYLPALMILFFAVSSITVLSDQTPPWEQKHVQLQQQRDIIFVQFEKIQTTLVVRVKDEDPSLLTRVSLDPPKTRVTGYGLS